MIIQDGKGTGYSAAVNGENMLRTIAVTEPSFLHHNQEEGDAYVWDFPGYDYDAADTIMFLRNDSNTPLYINHIYLYSDTASKVQLHLPSSPSAAAGTEVTGVNLKLQSGNVAEATAYQDETGNTQGTVMHTEYIAANGALTMLKEDGYEVVLGKNDCIAVDLVTAGTMAYGHIVGYYCER